MAKSGRDKFKGKYRIDSGEKGSQTRYASSAELQQKMEEMARRHSGRVLKVFVYAHPAETAEEDNQGNYIFSEYCTAVIAEIRRRLERSEQ